MAQHEQAWRMLFVTAGSVRVHNSETEQSQIIEQGQAHVTYFGIALTIEDSTPACQGWLVTLDQAAYEDIAASASTYAVDGARWRAVGPWQRQFNPATHSYLTHLFEHVHNRSDEPAIAWLGLQWAVHEFWRCWWQAEEQAPTGATSPLTKRALGKLHGGLPPPRGPAIAAELGVSPDHLARAFKRDMQMSIDGYRDQIRIEAALALLNERTMDLHDLADAVGYGSYAPFYRAFRKIVGLSPSAWLRRAPLSDR